MSVIDSVKRAISSFTQPASENQEELSPKAKYLISLIKYYPGDLVMCSHKCNLQEVHWYKCKVVGLSTEQTGIIRYTLREQDSAVPSDFYAGSDMLKPYVE